MSNKFCSLAKKTFAFTLAETLIVIGVIGIVSALTLPNLNSSTGEKEKVAKVQKLYQNIQDAFGCAVAVYGPYEEWFVEITDNKLKSKRAGERITEFMKTSKVCGLNTGEGCFSTGDDNSNYTYKIITADGASMYFDASSGENGHFYMVIDIDGPNKGAAKAGVDYFHSTVSYNVSKRELETYCGSDVTSSTFIPDDRKCAFSWIIAVGNMEYLKTKEDGTCINNPEIRLDGTTFVTCK
ncbi:type II secretion system protein [bacterium]|nr:type II secretion system protein [bacterium]